MTNSIELTGKLILETYMFEVWSPEAEAKIRNDFNTQFKNSEVIMQFDENSNALTVNLEVNDRKYQFVAVNSGVNFDDI